MILSGKAEKAFPRGGIAKKNKSESSTETSTKKFKENDDLFSSKHDFVKSKPVSSDSTKGKTKKAKKGEKAEDKDDDILTVKQVNLFKAKIYKCYTDFFNVPLPPEFLLMSGPLTL